MKDIKHILFVTLSNIGDVVMTLPVIGALKENFKEVDIDVVVGPRAKEIFDIDPRIGRVYIYNKSATFFRKLQLLKKLRKKKYSLVVDMRNSLFGLLVSPWRWNGPNLDLSKEAAHKIDEHLSRIKSLGLATYPNSYPIWITQTDEDNMSKLLGYKGVTDGDGIICVSPGAKSHIKRWVEGNFAAVCDKLMDEFGLKVVFVGDSADKQICERILDRMKNRAASIAGDTNLRELAWCIKRSKLLITNDSAPLHIAGSVGTPSVAVFGPTDYRKYGPKKDMGTALYKKLHCSPCEVAQCKYNLECMKAVLPDEVIEAASKILNENKKR